MEYQEKIERAKTRIEFTIEAIDRMIDDEQRNLDRYYVKKIKINLFMKMYITHQNLILIEAL